MILAPIFTSRSRSVASDHCPTASGGTRGAQEVAEVVGQRVQLKPYRVGGEAAARQPGPGDGVLALPDPLLGRATLVVERHHSLGRAPHVGHDEPDAWI